MHIESSSHDKAYKLDNGSFSTTRDRETVVHNEDQGLPEINQPDIGQVASGERQVESLTDVDKYEYLTEVYNQYVCNLQGH